MSDKNTERAMIMMNMTAMLQLTIEKAMSAAELSLEDVESCKKMVCRGHRDGKPDA